MESEEYAGVPKELIDAQREGTHKQAEHTDKEHEAWVKSRIELRHSIDDLSEIFFDRHGNKIRALTITRLMTFLDKYLEANQVKDK